MSEWWQAFHFLRPHLLWLMLAVPVIYLSLAIRDNTRTHWKPYIEPELLDHLIVARRRRWRFRPVHMISLLILLGSLSCAGPYGNANSRRSLKTRHPSSSRSISPRR